MLILSMLISHFHTSQGGGGAAVRTVKQLNRWSVFVLLVYTQGSCFLSANHSLNSLLNKDFQFHVVIMQRLQYIGYHCGQVMFLTFPGPGLNLGLGLDFGLGLKSCTKLVFLLTFPDLGLNLGLGLKSCTKPVLMLTFPGLGLGLDFGLGHKSCPKPVLMLTFSGFYSWARSWSWSRFWSCSRILCNIYWTFLCLI